MQRITKAQMYKHLTVRWWDATSWDDWAEMKAHTETVPFLVVSTGWLIKTDKAAITLVGTYIPAKENRAAKVLQSVTIPVGCIEHWKELKESGLKVHPE